MRVGVTGASGFVGSYLIPELVLAGHEVVRLRRPIGGEAPGALDALVHLGGLAHSRGHSAPDYHEANVETSKAVAALAMDAGARSVVFLSTSLVYGLRPAQGAISSLTTTNPQGDYASSKLAAERMLTERLGSTLRLHILRPPVIYGPEAKGNMRHIVRAVALGLPLPQLDASRSYLSVRSLSTAIAILLGSGGDAGAFVAPIADAEPITTTELIEVLAERSGNRWATVPGSRHLQPMLKAANRLLFRDRYGSLFSDLHLDPTEIMRLAPGFVPANTLDEAPRMLLESAPDGAGNPFRD